MLICRAIINRAIKAPESDLNPVGTRHYTSQLFIRHRDPLTLHPILDADQRQYAFINPKT
jgi:hypothetical protein